MEEEALKWDSNIDDRSFLWKEWTLCLKDPNPSNYYDGFIFVPFKQVFLTSRTLENITKNVLVHPFSKEDDTTLYDLFRCCCVGEDNEIYNFVTQLRSISESLKGKTKSPYYNTIINSVIEIVSQIKVNQNDSQSNSMYTSLQSLDSKIYETESLVQNDLTSKKAKNLVDLYRQKRISLSKTLRKKSVEEMENFFINQEENIKKNFKEIKGSVVLELQKIEEEKNQYYNSYQSDLIQITDKINEIKAQQRDLTSIQAQLEEKLREVKKELSENLLHEQKLDSERKDLTQKMNKIRENYLMRKERIKVDELNQQEDIEVFQKMNEFITNSKTLLKESIQKKNSNIQVMYYKSSKNYLDQVENYLKNSNEELITNINKIENIIRDIAKLMNEYSNNIKDPKLKEGVQKAIETFEICLKQCEKLLTDVNQIYQELEVFPEIEGLSTKKAIQIIQKISGNKTVINEFKQRITIIVQSLDIKKEEIKKEFKTDEILKEEEKNIKQKEKTIGPKKDESKKGSKKEESLPPMFSFNNPPKKFEKVKNENKNDSKKENFEVKTEIPKLEIETKVEEAKTETLPSIFDFGSPKQNPETKDLQTKKKKKKKNHRKEERKQKEDERYFE